MTSDTSLALFNGLRFGVMHCDVGPRNLLLRVPALDTKDVIPPSLDVGWVKRGALLSDWGLGLKVRGTSSKNAGAGRVTVSNARQHVP